MAACNNSPECIYSKKSEFLDITSFETYAKCRFCSKIDYCSEICRIKNWSHPKKLKK